ncbi:MAG: HAMP domain-containing sensor histidine kinase [Magnetovibrio sp.]|nr:HAMP domain-containing sensor histidine kinase [Magnetovibrio sp.]
MDLPNRERLELDALRKIFQETSPYVGEDFLKSLVRGLGQLLEAETTFVARVLDDPPTRVRGLAAWKDGAHKDSWEYDLEGNPCHLTYDGTPTYIPCDLAKDFPKKRDSGYESYLGIPLFNPAGDQIGHIAVYSSKVQDADDFALEIAQLCGYRAEAEVQRLIAEGQAARRIAELTESDQKKSEIVQVVSHELRTPLSSVIGYLSLLDREELPKPVDTYIGAAMEGAERLLHFINQELDLEKITSGEFERSDDVLDMSAVARAAVERLQPVAKTSGIRLEFEAPDVDAAIKGDAGHLDRVLDNLLSNALKASPEGSTITVSAAAEGTIVRTTITDQGPGIPIEFQDRIFERFGRAPASNERQRGGAGLGLNIAKAIVEDHGGEIGFSTRVGKGTVFFFELPRAA